MAAHFEGVAAREVFGAVRLAVAAAVTLSCGSGSERAVAPTPTVASLSLSDSSLTVEVGFSHLLTGTPRSSDGTPLSGVSVSTAWDSVPVAVMISGFSDADSARIWDALRAMEAAVGRPLFTTVWPGSGITVSAGLAPGVTGFAGYAQWSWDTRHRITSARVWFAASLTRPLVQHEFLHALGFGHTCSWPSPMGGYGCTSVEMTASDVAYVKIARAVFDAETPLRLTNGALPCGAMGVWAAAELEHSVVVCDGDSWQLAVETEPAPLLAEPPGLQPRRRTYSVP